MKKLILIFLLIIFFVPNPLPVKAQNTLTEQQTAILVKMIDLLLRQIQYLQAQLNILIANQKIDNQAIKDIQNSGAIAQPQTEISDIPTISPIVSPTTAEMIASVIAEDNIKKARQKELEEKNEKLWKLFQARHHKCSVFLDDSFMNSNQEWCDNRTRVGVDISELQNGIIAYCEKSPCKCTPKTAEYKVACPW